MNMAVQSGRQSPNRDRLYGRRWRRERKAFLAAHPLCVMCETRGRVAAATVVDHIRPHNGDPVLFWDRTNWQGLCQTHHDATKQREEKGGRAIGCGADGVPLDPDHPWAKEAGRGPARRGRRRGFSIPDGIRRSAVPVHLVCGPPGAGKSSFVEARRTAADIVIDLDEIKERLGYSRYADDPQVWRRAYEERARMLHRLASRPAGRAWLVVTAAQEAERRAWVAALGNVTVHAIETPAEECKRRIRADPARKGHEDKLCAAVDRYFRKRREEA